jgi:hypothetical protein
MFEETVAFNQDLDSWQLDSALNLSKMFSYARAFNGKVESWNTKNVTRFGQLFFRAESFNRSLGQWDLSNATNEIGWIIMRSGMDCVTYSSTLNGWALNPNTPDNITINAFNLVYGINAADARRILIDHKNWTFTNDKFSSEPCRSDNLPHCVVNQETFSFYPNPTNEMLNMSQLGDLLGCSYKVLNSQGSEIVKGIIETPDTMIDLGSYSSGLYFLIIGDTKMNPVYKLVKN